MAVPFKPNRFKKAWWKYTDKPKYLDYKYQKDHNKAFALFESFQNNEVLSATQILEIAQTTDEFNFSHSGNSGDIIYALPVIKKISELINKPVNLLLELNLPMQISRYYVHPLGNVMLNQKMADGLIPLISSQEYMKSCQVLTNQTVHVNLSKFRESGILTDRGSIARWNFYTTGVIGDVINPWLYANKDSQFADTIIVARSSRYNNPLINYSFLSKYKNLAFVGVESEYQAMKKIVPEIKYLPVDNFLQMAQIIASCKFFIGNQSFPYSIAEGLKSKRLLEVFYQAPNVLPDGLNGYDFYFQNHFEYLVEALSNNQQL